jgi:Tfp pilus assembly protein FimT
MRVVISIIVLLTALMVPAFNMIRGGTDFTSAVYDISSFLDQARAYAMANNTYVYVGFQEVNVSQSSGVSPQTAATSAVGGRIGLFAVASSNGVANLASSGTTSGSFLPLGKLQHFDNVHLASVAIPGATSPTVSASSAPGLVQSGTNLYSISTSGTPLFTYSLGANSILTPSPTTTAQYSFYNQSLQFDPQGMPRIVMSGSAGNIVPYIAIGLQQTHGSPVPTADVPLEAAIQIDGMTGVNRLYRQ